MCRDERPYKAVTLQAAWCRKNWESRFQKFRPSDNSSSGARQASLQSSLLSCWDFTHSFSSRSVQQMISETPPLCLASVYAQELLDYLKQFDKDGKGALSKEELQEVMRGTIPISREINTEW